ncbi:MAG: erythromycin esterase family protein [Polyangiales bacterium]
MRDTSSLLFALVLSVLLVGCGKPAVSAPKECTEPAGRPLSDDAILAAVGDARIVALGEADHGDAATLELKAHLVQLLHARAGFEVLAFESSLWDVHRMDNDLRKGTAVEVAAHEGLFPALADDPSVRALLAFATSTRDSPHALQLAGFDPQFSGDDRELPFARMLAEATGKCAFVPEALRGRIEAAFKRFPKRQKFTPLDPQTRTTDAEAFIELRSLLKSNQSAFLGVVGMSEAPFVMRTLDSILGLYQWHDQVATTSVEIDWKHVAVNNARDRLMAENVAWLRKQLPGRKIILWGATSHLVRDLSPTQPVAGFDLTGYEPMGRFVARDASAKYFVLGVSPEGGGMLDVRGTDCAFTARAIGNVPMTNVWSRSLDVLIGTERK